jgi:hypothetical protein
MGVIMHQTASSRQEPDRFTLWLLLAAACAVRSCSNTAVHVLRRSV